MPLALGLAVVVACGLLTAGIATGGFGTRPALRSPGPSLPAAP